ncbi:PPC domain-containing protein [soil metagenome]
MNTLIRLLLISFVVPGMARAAMPEFSATQPRGVQRGMDTKVTFTGNRLEDFEGVIFYSPGISLKSVDKVEKSKVETTFTIAPEVPLGNHFLRLRTRSGVSFMRQIMVGPYPGVDEKEPNNDFETPQEVGFNQTVEGLVASEDVDYYKISAKKGQRISLEIEGMRLGYIAFDPFIAILNANRFELISSDDTVLNRQDGYLSMVAPEDGDYIIQVRESSYRGTGNSYYRLHIGSFRRPDVCYPSGGKIGSTQKIKFIEKNGDVTEEDVLLPAESTDKYPVYLKNDPAPSGNIMRVRPYDNTLEAEPNDDFEHATKSGATAPIALNGIIEKPGDIDYFKFNLTKGQKVDFFTYAQTLGSPLDSVMVIYNAKGANVGSNDDGNAGRRRLDSKFTFTAPEDGEYAASVTDHLSRGGPNFVYRIEAEASVPDVAFSSPNFGVNDSHKRQFIAVPRGNRYATLVNITRNNASGDMTFELPNLPAGVKLLTPNIPGNQSSYPLLFEAEANAPLAGAAVPIALKPVDANQKVEGKLEQVFDMVRSGNTIYYTETIDKLPIATIEEVPYTLELVKPAVPMVGDGILDLKVIAKRKEGFKAPIRVLMVWRPPGVNSQGEVEIPAEKDEAVFTLDSKADVTPATYQFTVLGESEGGNGTVYAASPFTDLTVTTPFLSGSIPLTAVEQGKETDFVCKLEQLKPFEGEAVAQILGVPNGVKVESLKINKDSKEAVFKIKTDNSAPVGKHTTLFCQVEVPVPGGFATHRLAGGATLRIDAPSKAPAPTVAAATPQAATPVAATDAPKKQLTRLEQLREEQNKAGAK